MSETGVMVNFLMFFIGIFGAIVFVGYEDYKPRMQKNVLFFFGCWAVVWILPPLVRLWIKGVMG